MALVDAELTFVLPKLILETACIIYLNYRSVKTKMEFPKARRFMQMVCSCHYKTRIIRRIPIFLLFIIFIDNILIEKVSQNCH